MSIERCHFITRVKSKQNSIQNLFETVKSIESRVQNGLYEFPWLFKVRSSVIYLEETDPEERLRDAFCSMIREQDKMIPEHFIENYHSCVINDKMIGDPYHPDLAEFKYFKEKPLNFLVIGKPGLNTDTVAYCVAEIWRSLLISPSIAVKTVLPYILDNKSKTKTKEGEHKLTLEQILEAVSFMQTSAESKRQGYVLTGFPLSSFSKNAFDIEKQMDLIFKNITRPNIIIYLTCPNTDVILLNEKGYFRNIHNNNLYFKRHIEDGELVYLQDLDTRSVDFENNKYLLKEYHKFMQEEKLKFFVLESDTNLNNNILDDYVNKIFPILDRYLLQYDSQCVFKVDGRHTTVEIIETIQDKLNILCLSPLCSPSPVFDMTIDDGVATKPDSLSFKSILSVEDIKFDALRKTIEEGSEGVSSKEDDDKSEEEADSEKRTSSKIDLLVLDRYKNIEKQEAFDLLKKDCSPQKGFNLLVSDYNNLCPVEMHRGYICEGEIDYACKYAGKLFLLSSLDAVRKFLKDPARYALSPPLTTRKVTVIGPPMTGKSTVAYYLSGFFGIRVISLRRLIEKVYSVSMRQMEGNLFEMFLEIVGRLQRVEDERHRASEELRALEIEKWIREQIPFIIDRLKYSSFTSTTDENRAEENLSEISKQPLILPDFPFDDFIDNLKKEIKMKTRFEVNFGGKFTQLYKNPRSDYKEQVVSLTEADSSMLRLRDYFSSKGFDFFDDVIRCKEFLTDPLKLAVYLPSNLRLPEKVRKIDYEDVLKSVLYKNGIHTAFGFLRMNVENLADALEDEILDIEAENNIDCGRECDLKMGGWILDGLPVDEGLWSEMITRFLLPDDLICKIVDQNCLDSVKEQFLKVEPFTKLKYCYDELVKSSRRAHSFDLNETSLGNGSFGEQSIEIENISSETREDEKFLMPNSSLTSFITVSKQSKNPFNSEDHEINFLRANFWCDSTFLTDYFEQSVTKYLKSAKLEKVSALGNLHRVQNKESLESIKSITIRLSFADDAILSRSITSDQSSSLVMVEDLTKANRQNSIDDKVLMEEYSNRKSMNKSITFSEIVENDQHKKSSVGSEGLRIMQGYILKLLEKHLENIKSEDYLHWNNEREISFTEEITWTAEEHCNKSNSDLSSSVFSEDQGDDPQQNESESIEGKEVSTNFTFSNSCQQLFRGPNNYINTDMSMMALHSLIISELNLFKSSLDTWLVEPFDVSSEFLSKFKTMHPKQFRNEIDVPEMPCRSKSELEFYRKVVTDELNLINAVEALMKQDDQFDKVVDYLHNYSHYQHDDDNLSNEKCYSATVSSMIPKREKETTNLPNATDSSHQIRSLDGSLLSDSDEINLSADSLSVFEWYVVSDDVLFFSRHSSDYLNMVDSNEQPSEIHLQRTSKDMQLPHCNKPTLKDDLSSLKSFPLRREERPCIWRDCVETKVCHKKSVERCESVNTICKNVVKDVINSVTCRKKDKDNVFISSKDDSKYRRTSEQKSNKAWKSSENYEKFSTTEKAEELIKCDTSGSEQDLKCVETGEETVQQILNPIEVIPNDSDSTQEDALKTVESTDVSKPGENIRTSNQFLTDKSKVSSHSYQEPRSENSSYKSKTSSTKIVSIKGDYQSESSKHEPHCSQNDCLITECPYMRLTPFETPRNDCLLPNVSADNWMKFLSFISYIYSNIGEFEDRSSGVNDDGISISKSDEFRGESNGESIRDESILNSKDSDVGNSDSKRIILKNAGRNSSVDSKEIKVEDDLNSDKNTLGNSNVEDNFKTNLRILSKLKINLPIPQDQFDTCLDIALRCLTAGKTIEEMFSCHPLLCSDATHFTADSLEKLFGEDNVCRSLHKCLSRLSGNVSVKYRDLPDVQSEETKSSSIETVEVFLKPSLIYSVDTIRSKESAVKINENNYYCETNFSQYSPEFLQSVPRAILHLIEMSNDSDKKVVESEHVARYCYLVKNYKHLRKFDKNGEFHTKLKQLSKLQDENSNVFTMENYISAQINHPDVNCLRYDVCSFLSDRSLSILSETLSSLESISGIDLENLMESTILPTKLAIFVNSVTSSIQAWLKDWHIFKKGFLAKLNRCNLIEQRFIPDCKDFPDTIVCKLLSSYGSKTVQKIYQTNEKLIKVLSRDQSEDKMNDFIENITPVDGSESTLEGNNENSENLSNSDVFPYCPVTYKEEGKLFIAGGQFSAIFKDEVYNFATKSDMEKFVDNPENYAVQPTSDYRVPPLRICVLSNLLFNDEKRLTRQMADYFNLQSVSFIREVKRMLLQNASAHLGLINEDTTNMEMFDLGETMFDQDDNFVKKLNYVRDYLNLKRGLSQSDLKILVDQLFCSSTGKVIYGFPHIDEDLSFILKEKITPNVVVYIDLGDDDKKKKIESLERKVRAQQLLNYGSRLRKLMKLDRLKYILWNSARSKLFNIVLRQLLKQRRDDKLPTKRLNQLFSRKRVTTETNGENSKQNVENDLNAVKVDSEEGFQLKKSPKAGNILYSRKIGAKNRDEFRAYLLEKRRERTNEIEIYNCKSQTGDLKLNETENIYSQSLKFLKSSIVNSHPHQSSSFESQEMSNYSKESLREVELDDRRQVASMDLRNVSKEQDRYLPKFESVHYLPADYDAKREYYLERSSKGSSENMGMNPTDSICSREIPSSINIHPNLPSSKKSRKIALQYGVHKISEEFLINAYDIFRKKYPPPKSNTRNLKPINFQENTESLNTYYSNETKNINAMEDLCSKYNVPFIKHSPKNSSSKLLESIKSITRWPDVFEKCRIISHKTASELLNNGHYFFSKFGRWCPVAILEKRLPILQNYPEGRMEKLVHPVIHKKYIYFIHTRASLDRFVSSPLKYIEQDPYLTVFPIKIAVVGCPKSAKTKIIEYLRNLYGLEIVRVDTAVQYVCTQLHWTELSQKIHVCLKQGELLAPQLTVEALNTYILSSKFVNHGWILDGFPITKDDVQFMKKFDIIPQVTVCVETDAAWENCVLNKLNEERVYLENLNDGLLSNVKSLKNDDEDGIMLEKNNELDKDDDDCESLFYRYLPPRNFFKYRILKWRQNRVVHDELKTTMHDSWGNLLEISWKRNHLKMVARVLEFVKTCLLAFQNYATNMQQSLPAAMFCLNLTKSEFEMHMSVFKEVCPCCWYYYKIYHRCPTQNFRDMTTGLFQYGNYIYWICTEHTDIFLHSPTIFLSCNEDVFKRTYPERLSLIGEKTIEQYFDLQFQGNCVTCYVKNLPSIVLKKGLKTFALALKNKHIYLFCQESCLLSMLIKPQDFCSIKLPRKLLKNPKLSPKVSSTSSTVCTSQPIIVTDYFEKSNIYDVLCKALMRVAKVRPRIFEINNEISSGIYLALILKAHANRSKVVVLNNILACFETYSQMIHVTCSFIDKLACALNVSNLDENENTEIHTQYFFDRLIPLLASNKNGKSIRNK